MTMFPALLSTIHLVGVALAVGAATVKLTLLLRCRADHALLPHYLAVIPVLTRQIILGMILMTLTGIGWLLLGYRFSPLLVVKIVLVAAVWVLGPVIDNRVEPRFRKLAPGPGETPSAAFLGVQGQYVMLEVLATLMFYVIIVAWAAR